MTKSEILAVYHNEDSNYEVQHEENLCTDALTLSCRDQCYLAFFKMPGVKMFILNDDGDEFSTAARYNVGFWSFHNFEIVESNCDNAASFCVDYQLHDKSCTKKHIEILFEVSDDLAYIIDFDTDYSGMINIDVTEIRNTVKTRRFVKWFHTDEKDDTHWTIYNYIATTISPTSDSRMAETEILAAYDEIMPYYEKTLKGDELTFSNTLVSIVSDVSPADLIAPEITMTILKSNRGKLPIDRLFVICNEESEFYDSYRKCTIDQLRPYWRVINFSFCANEDASFTISLLRNHMSIFANNTENDNWQTENKESLIPFGDMEILFNFGNQRAYVVDWHEGTNGTNVHATITEVINRRKTRKFIRDNFTTSGNRHWIVQYFYQPDIE